MDIETCDELDSTWKKKKEADWKTLRQRMAEKERNDEIQLAIKSRPEWRSFVHALTLGVWKEAVMIMIMHNNKKAISLWGWVTGCHAQKYIMLYISLTRWVKAVGCDVMLTAINAFSTSQRTWTIKRHSFSFVWTKLMFLALWHAYIVFCLSRRVEISECVLCI